jgi:YidC/Oxa1 family membrane protein insertase
VVRLWEVVVVQPVSWLLDTIYAALQGVPLAETIGAYGIAIIVVTIIIRLLLAPLQQFQLATQRKTMAEQRKLAPEVAELRKKYKKDPQLNAKVMELYKEHGVNPLGGMVGCLPLIVQLPVLYALYNVFRNAHVSSPHFLFVPNLMEWPTHTALIAGLPVPALAYLVFPLLAAATTFVQSKMLQQPVLPNATEQERQTQQMQRTMIYISPLMIGVFALQVPAGLGLYWFIGNCIGIIQQSFFFGWGNLVPSRWKTAPPPAGLPKGIGPGNGPMSGARELPPKRAAGGVITAGNRNGKAKRAKKQQRPTYGQRPDKLS